VELDASHVLIKPIITEKSMAGSSTGRYTFRVHPQANKILIKQAAKKYLNIDVVQVNTSWVGGKSRRFGRTQGTTKSWKKAIITVKPGQKIALFES
jgi:large subunit ribosomal protein L23